MQSQSFGLKYCLILDCNKKRKKTVIPFLIQSEEKNQISHCKRYIRIKRSRHTTKCQQNRNVKTPPNSIHSIKMSL